MYTHTHKRNQKANLIIHTAKGRNISNSHKCNEVLNKLLDILLTYI